MSDSIDPTKTLTATVTPPARNSVLGTQQADFARHNRNVTIGDGDNKQQKQVRSHLSHAGMQAVIASKQSVILNGQVLSRLDELPSESQLAISTGNQDDIDRRRKENDAEMARLKAENENLRNAAASASKGKAGDTSPVGSEPKK